MNTFEIGVEDSKLRNKQLILESREWPKFASVQTVDVSLGVQAWLDNHEQKSVFFP